MIWGSFRMMSNRRTVFNMVKKLGTTSVDLLEIALPRLSKKQIQYAIYKLHDYGEITKVGTSKRVRRYGKPYSTYSVRRVV